MRTFLILLNPFAPHLSSELWEKMRAKFAVTPADITEQSWPDHDEGFLVEDEVEIVVQVNGKVRDRLTVPTRGHGRGIESSRAGVRKFGNCIAGKQIAKSWSFRKSLSTSSRVS